VNLARTRSLILPLLAALVAVLVAGCGEDESSARSAGNGVDRAFVVAMIPHHESAVEMAEMAKERAQHKAVKRLADAIAESQNREIETMTRLGDEMDAAGVEKGELGVADHEMGMGADMEQLGTAKPFDRAFIDAMIPHHQGAIVMARAQLQHGQSHEVKQLAEAIIDAQAKDIDQMNMWRVDWYGGLSPAGGVPPEAHGTGGDMHDMGH
jgi:uncharacterized protein (DUF305 family)